MFFCGEGGCHVEIENEHDEAGRQHAIMMNRAYREATGEWASMQQQIAWTIEGYEASARHATIAESRAIDAAVALLEKHRYRVLSPQTTTDERDEP